jgi:hypothetical protein
MRTEGRGFTDYRRARLPVIGDGDAFAGGENRLDARFCLSALLHETLWRELGRIAVDEPTCGSGRVGRPRVKPGVNFTVHGVLPPRSACKCDAGEKASMAARIAPGAAQWARSGQAGGRPGVNPGSSPGPASRCMGSCLRVSSQRKAELRLRSRRTGSGKDGVGWRACGGAPLVGNGRTWELEWLISIDRKANVELWGRSIESPTGTASPKLSASDRGVAGRFRGDGGLVPNGRPTN